MWRLWQICGMAVTLCLAPAGNCGEKEETRRESIKRLYEQLERYVDEHQLTLRGVAESLKNERFPEGLDWSTFVHDDLKPLHTICRELRDLDLDDSLEEMKVTALAEAVLLSIEFLREFHMPGPLPKGLRAKLLVLARKDPKQYGQAVAAIPVDVVGEVQEQAGATGEVPGEESPIIRTVDVKALEDGQVSKVRVQHLYTVDIRPFLVSALEQSQTNYNGALVDASWHVHSLLAQAGDLSRALYSNRWKLFLPIP